MWPSDVLSRRPPVLAGTLVALVAAGGVAACSPAPSPAPRLAPTWRPASLPAPPGRWAVVADLTVCAGEWFAVGGVAGADGTSAPAAWASRDGDNWTPLPVHPASYYGQRSVFSAVACRGNGSTVDLVAVGAASGGVHGNPRTATWRGDASGGIAETPAPFERYGGPDAVTVGRVAAGPQGFLVVGDRVSPRTSLAGAAAWYSRDGGAFTLVDSDPALGSDASAATSAADATALPGGWLAVGSVARAGAPAAAREPGAWYSADGATWRRETVPRDTAGRPADDDEALDRVTPWHGGTLALGVRGDRFGAWLRDPGAGWRPGGRFGAFAGSAVPAITGLAAGRESVYAGGCDGAAYRLWASRDGRSWREVHLPVAMAPGAQRRLLVAAGGGRLAVVADDGAGARIWLAAEPTGR